jgi:hypothetical protein
MGPGRRLKTPLRLFFPSICIAVMALGTTTPGIARGSEPVAPQTTGVSPDHGPRTGGNTVVITGVNFTGATAVNFGSWEAENFTVDSDSEITAVAPPERWPGEEGAVVDVSVSGPNGMSSWSPAARYGYAPVIDRIKPAYGPALGGTAVTLFGYGLEEATAVDFGAVPAESFTVNPDGSITAVSPPRQPGGTIVPVTATTPEGITEDFLRQEVEPANYFTYGPTVTQVIPNLGPEAGAGTEVTILGTGFASPLFRCLCAFPFTYSLSFGSSTLDCGLPQSTGGFPCAPVEFEVISDHEITATVPPGHGTVSVAVETRGGISPPNPEAQFTYPPDRSPPDTEEPPLQLLMSCVVSKHAGGRAAGFCSSRSFTVEEETALPAGPVRVSLRRGKALYATGTARVHRQTTHLFLKPVRPVRGGRYELVLSRPATDHSRRWSRRESVVLH